MHTSFSAIFFPNYFLASEEMDIPGFCWIGMPFSERTLDLNLGGEQFANPRGSLDKLLGPPARILSIWRALQGRVSIFQRGLPSELLCLL